MQISGYAGICVQGSVGSGVQGPDGRVGIWCLGIWHVGICAGICGILCEGVWVCGDLVRRDLVCGYLGM